MFNKILIANRGEIAVRVIAACKEMGITSAAVYSEADSEALHVTLADEAYLLGPPTASESYLNIPKILAIAKNIGADAIHPGYGFLSENAEFIELVENAGLTFIGPSSDSVKLMGSKTEARSLMYNNNVPIVPGTTSSVKTSDEALSIAKEIGLPIMLKASAGGGGKGMRLVTSENELISSMERAQNEAAKAFGNADIYIEKFIENPKHIEVQILGDKFGNYVHLFERDCSIQRRHQKVLEESPSIFINEEIRDKITTAAINAAKACNYHNAGTIEFLMDSDFSFYFLEMNTRLQVEHPVTELVTGVDLVKEQIKIAAGEKLSLKQSDISKRGHALECRIYAEDIYNNFAPSTGKIEYISQPTGPGVRLDTGITQETEVPIYYDPLLSKIITWGQTRKEAISRMKRVLNEYQILGVITNIELFNWIFIQPKFIDGSFTINFLEDNFIPSLIETDISEQIKDEHKIILFAGTLLKEKDNSLSNLKINSDGKNKWEDLKYE